MNTKQVIIVRTDLEMRKGKMIAQGAHASMKVIIDKGFFATAEGKTFMLPMNDILYDWLNGIFTKIAVKAESEQQLLDLYQQAQDAGIICSLIQDAGLTEFHGVPTYTAVAIGPDTNENIDPITKDLKLL